jgi:hypothetical protein
MPQNRRTPEENAVARTASSPATNAEDPMTTNNDGMKKAESERDARTVAAFEAQLRELKPLWNRNFLLVFMPGIILFFVGGPGGLLLPGGHANDDLRLIIPGIVLCVIGGVRGCILMWRYRRCPECGEFQRSGFRFPYRTCMSCGVKLTSGWKEPA